MLLQEDLDLGVQVVELRMVAKILIGVANVRTLIMAAPLVRGGTPPVAASGAA